MCGRYVQTTPPAALTRLFRTANPVPNHPPSWNVAPTQDGLVIRFNPETRARHLDPLRWGLVPRWAEDPSIGSRLINARAETLATKPAFREAYRKRRCLVPINAFYEWYAPAGSRTKHPYAVALASGEPMALAGLWEGWRAPDGTILRSFTVVTTDANRRLALLHDRMPVVVAAEDWPLWLGEEEEGDPARVLRPYPAEAFAVWPVSTRVNRTSENDAGLLDPLPGVPPIPGLCETTGPPPSLAVAPTS